MRNLVIYAVICLGPAAVFLAIEHALRLWSGMSHRHSAAEPPSPTHPPVERLAVDLHWLADEMTRLRASDAPAKVHRLTAVSLAYDDTLRMCCDALEVPVPEHRDLQGAERLQLEAELAQAGLDW